MARVVLGRAFQEFFTPAAIGKFVFGAVCVAVVGNTVTDLLKKWLGDDVSGLWKILGLAVVVLGGAVFLLWWAFNRSARTVAKLDKESPAACPGLIFLVGRRDVFDKAVVPHEPKLQHVWLVHSPETLSEAEKIAAGEREKGRLVNLLAVGDVHDPDVFLRVVRGVYGALPGGVAAADVIADYTGLTAHASVGMALACLEAGAPLQYTPPANAGPGPVKESLPPFRVTIREVLLPRSRVSIPRVGEAQ